MRAAAILRDKINSDALVAGVLVTDHLWPGVIETMALAGLDYLIVDREHGAFADDLVADVCAIGRMTDFAVLIRTVDTAYPRVRQAADLGACGLLLPGIESTDQLDQVREAIYMPPRGRRRPGGAGNRWLADFNYPSWKRDVEDHFIVLPQIETRTGLAQADAIAAHALTTAIAIGPYDLSADLGCCWDPVDPRLLDAVQRIRDAGVRAGKNMWHIGDGPTLVGQGFNFICVGEPMGMLKAAAGDAVAQCRAAKAGGTFEGDAAAKIVDQPPP